MRQGDPLSPFLFNLVLDLTLAKLGDRLGYKLENGAMLTHLAFADDVVLVSSSSTGLQALIESYTLEAGRAGLEVNPGKCSTLRMVIDGKVGKWVVNKNARFLINNQAISCLGPTDTSKYLGLQVGAHTSNKDTIIKLQQLIDKISGSPLKPQQRLWALRNNIIPKIQHPLVLSPAAVGLLKTLDVMVRGAVRSWLHLPKDVPRAFFHASLKDGGLGIPALVNRIPRLQSARLSALRTSEDPVVMDAMRSEFVKSD